tara:strand:+ start:7774 stop:8412 length:639 start_codon:yes stop_codon:yes gene_type:complete
MNKKNFIKILNKPKNLSKEEVSFIKEINLEFPYFQTGKAIYLKHLKDNDDIKYERFLSLTAAYSRDREVLYNLIYDIDNQNENHFSVKKEIENIFTKENKINIDPNNGYNSFVDWLKISNIKPIDRTDEKKLVNKFISKKPKINIKYEEEAVSRTNDDLLIDSEYMTETLAKLYQSQKNYEKAIQAYKILILKFPEKNSYFANQIKKINSLK